MSPSIRLPVLLSQRPDHAFSGERAMVGCTTPLDSVIARVSPRPSEEAFDHAARQNNGE